MNLEKLDSDLNVFRVSNEKPNFAAIGRAHGVDYRTAKRHWLKTNITTTRNKLNLFNKLEMKTKGKSTKL